MLDALKNEWLGRLKCIHPKWVDGDINPKQDVKTADCVNEEFKVAIELKRDGRKYPNCDISFNAIRNQFKEFSQSANRKFRNYPLFKTCLIIKSPLEEMNWLASRSFFGYREILGWGLNSVKVSSIKDKFFSQHFIEIGAYLFYNDELYYFLNNPIAAINKKMTIDELKSLSGISKIEEIVHRGPSPFGI